jgi:SAM-dependent methyltransferase
MSSAGAIRYMPVNQGTFRGRMQRLFRSFAYFLWKRELKKFARTNSGRTLSVTDVGCGPGFLLERLRLWFPKANLTGIDSSQLLLSTMASQCDGVRALVGDACSIPLEDGSQDVLFCLHVVEHLPAPCLFFSEARRVLRPGGLLIVATPNLDGLGARIMKSKWSGYSDPTHISLHGADFWREHVLRAGFQIRRDGTTGLSGLPWLNKMPLGLLQWIPVFLFGMFPWNKGEAYICVAASGLSNPFDP